MVPPAVRRPDDRDAPAAHDEVVLSRLPRRAGHWREGRGVGAGEEEVENGPERRGEGSGVFVRRSFMVREIGVGWLSFAWPESTMALLLAAGVCIARVREGWPSDTAVHRGLMDGGHGG